MSVRRPRARRQSARRSARGNERRRGCRRRRPGRARAARRAGARRQPRPRWRVDRACSTVVVTGSADRRAGARADRRGWTCSTDGSCRETTRTRCPARSTATCPACGAGRSRRRASLSSYASIRGASSFGLSYPKIYIDGIEVANPLLVTRFAPDAIDRIEVIRGPQGSALYGTDAISGVVNIVTRHEGTGADGEHAMLRTTAGLVQSDFARERRSRRTRALARHRIEHALGGSARRPAGTVGEFIPNGYSRDLVAQRRRSRRFASGATFSATARFFTQQTGSATSPLLSADADRRSGRRVHAAEHRTAIGSRVHARNDGDVRAERSMDAFGRRRRRRLFAGQRADEFTPIAERRGLGAARGAGRRRSRNAPRAAACCVSATPTRRKATMTLSGRAGRCCARRRRRTRLTAPMGTRRAAATCAWPRW